MRRARHVVAIISLVFIAITTTGCGSGGALGQLVTAAFSPQAAVSDLQIKGAAIGGFPPIADILARFIPQPAPAKKEEPPAATSDGFPESIQEDPTPATRAPADVLETPVIPPEIAAILASALEEKYILEIGLLGQKKTIRLVCSGAEEIQKCKKIPPNAPVRASVVPIEGNLFDLRRIVED